MRIKIDTRACRDPLECRLCLERCPEKVFGTQPLSLRQPGVLSQDWVIFPLFATQCTGCMECMEFCPQQAIVVQPRSYYQRIRAVLSLLREIVFGNRTAWTWK